jgi:nucleotide-binding universal stress UspA family protein
VKVLLAIDDSYFADLAVSTLRGQLNPQDTEIRLLHVILPFPAELASAMGTMELPDFTAARRKLRGEAEEFLKQTAEKLRSAGFKVSHATDEGDPKSAILGQAESWPADLVVVGSHGRKGLDRFLMGSVSEAVARYARCSVEIVRKRQAG